jgi:hypothetical protein
MGLSVVGSTNMTSQVMCSPQINRVCDKHKPVLTVTTVVRKQPGGSQSCLVRCDDGKLYVLKMHPNPQGPNVLANEALGSILLHGLGFFVPRWRPVTIGLKAVRLFPELAMQTAGDTTTFPSCGIHFGSEYLGGPQYVLNDFIPRNCAHKLRSTAQLLPIYLFDIWASHQDERQCIYRRTRKARAYNTFIIDNGHLFGGPGWLEVAGRSRGACSPHIRLPLADDPRIKQVLRKFEDRIPKLLHRAIAAVPAEWYKDDIYALYARLLWRLDAIRLLVDLDILKRSRQGLVPDDYLRQRYGGRT